MTSVVGLESARVGVFCGSGDIATTPNGILQLHLSWGLLSLLELGCFVGQVILQLCLMGYLIYQVSLPFPNTLLVLLRNQQFPSSF